jgi:hypothetical protein
LTGSEAVSSAEQEKKKQLLEKSKRCRHLARVTPDPDLAADVVRIAEKYKKQAALPPSP